MASVAGGVEASETEVAWAGGEAFDDHALPLAGRRGFRLARHVGGRVTVGEGPWTVHPGPGVPPPGSVQGYTASYCGIDPFGTGCTCPSNRHDLDGFGRVFVPHTHLSSVLVLDSNFNRITRIGNYGNVDNNGPASRRPAPEIGLSSPNYLAVRDRTLCIADGGNKRILRIDLDYEAEAEAPLP